MGKTRFGFGVRHEAEMPQHKASMPIPFKQKTDYSHLFENRYTDIPKKTYLFHTALRSEKEFLSNQY